ncbi:MAG: 5-oxoprolinase subunit PxpA [Candidatus Obscuribacterales bacterium]|nr:5-oxoprolinase subunit PxpA [Candidatus Obscuribacterales bacterium]
MRRQRHRTRGNKESNNNSKETVNTNLPPNAKVYQAGIDINTNIGEGFGPYRIEGEDEILPFVTSANIACGAHSGDPVIMEAALEETRYYGLTLGAHIGYPDLAGFGRRELHLSPTELRASILFQLGALSGLARTLGFDISQVRPHGFLYRQMMSDLRIALIVARAIAEFDKWLVLIGPAGPTLLNAGDRAGIRVAGEAWVDRVYDANGHLLPHTHSRSAIKNPQDILRQAMQLVHHGTVTSSEGTHVKIDFQTLHVHAKIPQAKLVCEQLRSIIPNACSLTSEPFNVDNETERMHLAYSE